MTHWPRWMPHIADRSTARTVLALMVAGAVSGCIPPGKGPAYELAHAGRRAPPAPVAAPSRAAPFRAAPAEAPAAPVRTASVVRNAVRIDGATVTARTGDTLLSIAERTGVPADAIAATNAMVAPYRIYSGQELTLPGGLYHSVRDGETAGAIAQAYGVSLAALSAANLLEEPYAIRLGQRLLIPSATQ
jgi:lipoprotein NlpD